VTRTPNNESEPEMTETETIGPFSFVPLKVPRSPRNRVSRPCGCAWETVVTAADFLGYEETDVQVASCGKHQFPGQAPA
jgi:hypothetical protein